MDSDLYNQSVEYEKLTQAIYQAILNKEGLERISVEHNVNVEGRSKVSHQIDVLWRFKQAGVDHAVLVECKNYSSAITLEKVRNFFAVLHDIGNARGIMVTQVGYQSGVQRFAEHYGIDLKLLRKPTDADWQDRVRDIQVNLIAKAPVSTEEQPITVEMHIRPCSSEQEERLKTAQEGERFAMPSGPDLQLLDSAGVPATDEMRWWIPKELNVLDKEPGGPYEQAIELSGKYVRVLLGDKDELVEVIGLKVIFSVEEIDTREIAIHGDDVVQAILKDFFSGEVEHVHRK